jgi:hypothetical protein
MSKDLRAYEDKMTADWAKMVSAQSTNLEEFWSDPIINPIGSNRPVWLPR